MSIVLSLKEIAELTGTKSIPRQKAALDRMQMPYYVRLSGSICIIRAHAENWTPPEPEYPPPLPPLENVGPVSILQEPCVYFLQFVGEGDLSGLVKIGYSRQLIIRRRQIPKELGEFDPNWFEVLFTLPGDLQVEQGFHRKFHEHRRFGEWFEPEGALLEFMHGKIH